MAAGDCQSQPCRCAQHGPILGAVTFSAGNAQGGSRQASPEMIEHVRRAVDDYVNSLGEVEDAASTVVELVKRGESWHISIRAGGLYCENAEPSWEAAVACVARILGEKSGQSVDSCAEVPTDSAEFEFENGRSYGWAQALESLPPCRIDDPEALAKLTPSRVRAYLKGKGWTTSRVSVGEPWFESPPRANGCKCLLQPGNHSRADTLAAISKHESRSAAAVYLDILAAEPGES